MLRRDALKIENFFETFVIIFLIITFLYIIKNYLIAIFLAATLVFLVYKPYKKLAKKLKSETLASTIIISTTIIILLIPTYILSYMLIIETTQIINTSSHVLQNLNIDNCNLSICQFGKTILAGTQIKFETIMIKVNEYLLKTLGNIFSSISSFFINLAIFILAYYFLLKDGDKFAKYINGIIPMKNDYKNAIFLRFREVSLAVFIDSILIAIIQGTLLGIGLYFAGFNSPIFWGTIASICALLPVVGTAIVWIPAVVYLVATQNYITALFLSLYCLIIVSLSDNFMRMFMLKKKMQVHPFIVLISVMGGIEVFGFFGLFIGPIVTSLLITILQLYNLDFN